MFLAHFCCSQVNCSYSSHFINSTLECGVLLAPRGILPSFITQLKRNLEYNPVSRLCYQCRPRETLIPIFITATWATIQGEHCYPPGTVVPMNHVRAKVILCYADDCFLYVDILCFIGPPPRVARAI